MRFATETVERYRNVDGQRILHFRKLDSTNSEIARRAAEGAADGLVVIADCQEAGRGRRGRDWRSGSGNLAMSILVRDIAPVAKAAELSFAAALAAHDALCRTVRGMDGGGHPALARQQGEGGMAEDSARCFPLHLKWPNDLLLHGRKLGGILLEMDGPATDPRLIVGIGINLHDFPPDARYPATALKSHGLSCDRDALARALIGRFAQWRHHRREEGFAALRKAWISRAAPDWQGPVTLNLDGGLKRGRVLDLDVDGALLFCPAADDGQDININMNMNMNMNTDTDTDAGSDPVMRITAGEVCFGTPSGGDGAGA